MTIVKSLRVPTRLEGGYANRRNIVVCSDSRPELEAAGLIVRNVPGQDWHYEVDLPSGWDYRLDGAYMKLYDRPDTILSRFAFPYDTFVREPKYALLSVHDVHVEPRSEDP